MSVRLPDFLEGAVDLHVHSSPDIDERKFDDVSLARAAVQGGMRAIVNKSMIVTNPARLLGLRAA